MRRRAVMRFRTVNRVLPALLIFSLAWSTRSAGPAFAQERTFSPSDLRSFSIAVEAVSDPSPFWTDYVLDVVPGIDGTTVRWIRIAPLSQTCSTPVTLKAMRVTVPETIDELVAQRNICGLSEAAVNAALVTAARRGPIDDTARYGIALQCGR